jgi:hypothetical protein
MLVLISIIEPIQAGVLEGRHFGILGGSIGFMVGLVIAILWTSIFYSWGMRFLNKFKTGWFFSVIFILSFTTILFALPLMSFAITHHLTATFNH